MSSIVIESDPPGTPPRGQPTRDDHMRIPSACTVMRAFSHPTEMRDQHLVLAVAAKLATEHQMRAHAHHVIHDRHADDHVTAAAARTVAAHDTACAVLVDQIDRWAGTQVGASRAPLLHTESLGQLIDRLAIIWTRSCLVAEQGTGQTMSVTARVVRRQLSELSAGYDDLIAEVQRGRRRLPRYQTPTGPETA